LEAIAAGHPDVVESAAYGVPGEFGEDEVKLDVVLSDDAGSLEDLHAWLAERLPRYMVPRYLEACAAFPKTPSERIEKYKLLARGVERPDVREFERRAS
jgi:crotonobetaine/carnitine-CoA ligase